MKIQLKDIAKIQRLEMEIYGEQDNDYCDGRVIANKERAIYNVLAKITADVGEQLKIRNCIYDNMWNTEDLTFKPICDALRQEGYQIIKEEK